MGGRLDKEGMYVYLWLIHLVVEQKTTQHNIVKQLSSILKKESRINPVGMAFFHMRLGEELHISNFCWVLEGYCRKIPIVGSKDKYPCAHKAPGYPTSLSREENQESCQKLFSSLCSALAICLVLVQIWPSKDGVCNQRWNVQNPRNQSMLIPDYHSPRIFLLSFWPGILSLATHTVSRAISTLRTFSSSLTFPWAGTTWPSSSL